MTDRKQQNQPKGTKPKFGPPLPPKMKQARNQQRRQQRRRRPRGPRNMPAQPGSFLDFKETASVAKSAAWRQPFMRRGTAPVHKDFGAGCRVTGVSLACNVVTGSGTTTNYSVLYPIGTSSSTSWITTTSLPNANTYIQPYGVPLHPAYIDRPRQEAKNWSRYVFRKLTARYVTVANTTISQSFCMAISSDNALQAFIQQNTPTVVTPPILSVFADTVPSFLGPCWKDAAITVADFSGDKTWQTFLPADVSGSDTSVEATIRDDFFQFTLNMIFPQIPGTAQATQQLGYVMLDYVIDFYSPRYMGVIDLPASTSSLSTSSSSASTTSYTPRDQTAALEAQLERVMARVKALTVEPRTESKDSEWETVKTPRSKSPEKLQNLKR